MADEVDTHRGEEEVHKAVQCTIPRHFPALHHTTTTDAATAAVLYAS